MEGLLEEVIQPYAQEALSKDGQVNNMILQMDVRRDSVKEAMSGSSLPPNVAVKRLPKNLFLPNGTTVSLTRADVGSRGSDSDTIEIDHTMSWSMLIGYYLSHVPVQPCLVFDDHRLKSRLDDGTFMPELDAVSKRRPTLPVFCTSSPQEMFQPVAIAEPTLQTNKTFYYHDSEVTQPHKGTFPIAGVTTLEEITPHDLTKGFAVNASGSTLYVANYLGMLPQASWSKSNAQITPFADMSVSRAVLDTRPDKDTLWYTQEQEIDTVDQPFTLSNGQFMLRPSCLMGLKLNISEAPAFHAGPQSEQAPGGPLNTFYGRDPLTGYKVMDFELQPAWADAPTCVSLNNGVYGTMSDVLHHYPRTGVSDPTQDNVIRLPVRGQCTRTMDLTNYKDPKIPFITTVYYGSHFISDTLRARYHFGLNVDGYGAINNAAIAPPLSSATANIGCAKLAPARLYFKDDSSYNSIMSTSQEYIGYGKGMAGIAFVGSKVGNLQQLTNVEGKTMTSNLGTSFAPYTKKVTITVESGLYSVSDLITRINEQLNAMSTQDTIESEAKIVLSAQYEDATEYNSAPLGDYVPDGYLTQRKSVEVSKLQEWSANIPKEMAYLTYFIKHSATESLPIPENMLSQTSYGRSIYDLQGLCGNVECLMFKDIAPCPIPVSMMVNPSYKHDKKGTNDLEGCPYTYLVMRQVGGFVQDQDGNIDDGFGNDLGPHTMTHYRNQLWHLDIANVELQPHTNGKRLSDNSIASAEAYLVTQNTNLKEELVNISSTGGVFKDFTLGGLNAQLTFNTAMSRIELQNLHARFTLSDFTPQVKEGLPYCMQGSYQLARANQFASAANVDTSTIEMPLVIGQPDGGGQAYTYSPLLQRLSLQAEVATGMDVSSGVWGHEQATKDKDGNDIINSVPTPVVTTLTAPQAGPNEVVPDGYTVYGNHLPDTNRKQGVSGYHGCFIMEWYTDVKDLDLLFTLGFTDVTKKNKLELDTSIPPINVDGRSFPFYKTSSVYEQWKIGHTEEDINYSVVKERGQNINGTTVLEPPFQITSNAPIGFDLNRIALHGGMSNLIKAGIGQTLTFDYTPGGADVSELQAWSTMIPYTIPHAFWKTTDAYEPSSDINLRYDQWNLACGMQPDDKTPDDMQPVYKFADFYSRISSINYGWPIYKLYTSSNNEPHFDTPFTNLWLTQQFQSRLNGNSFPTQPPLGFEVGVFQSPDEREEQRFYTTRIKIAQQRFSMYAAIFDWIFGTWWTGPPNSDNLHQRARKLMNTGFNSTLFYRNTQQQRIIVATNSKGLRANTLPRKMSSTIYVLQCNSLNLFPLYSYMLDNGCVIPFIGTVSKLNSVQDMYQLGDTTDFTVQCDTNLSELQISVLNPDGSIPGVIDGDLTFGLKFTIPMLDKGSLKAPNFSAPTFNAGLPSPWPRSQLQRLVEEEVNFYSVRNMIIQTAEGLQIALTDGQINDMVVEVLTKMDAEPATKQAKTS